MTDTYMYSGICKYVHVCNVVAGTLLRKLENGLRGISHVIVDEIHERDINVCLAVYMCTLCKSVLC